MATLYRIPQYRTTTIAVPGNVDASQTTGIIIADLPEDLDVDVAGILALTWSNPVDEDAIEYITYTSINSGTKELQGVTRGQEGFSARAHNNGATVAWVVSKSHINNVVDKLTGADTTLASDTSGNEFIKTSKTTTAVNEFTVKNAATGTGPELQATGGDSNIDVVIQPKGTGTVTVKGTATSAAELRLNEDTDNGTNYIGLKAPASVGTSKTFILPDADGTSGQFLKTDGSATLSWGTVASDGWTSYSGTWTYASADDPTFTFTVAGVDLTTTLYAGMRIKLTQTTVKYFIITKVSFSTDTTVTIYGGTDYDLANAAITSPYYSVAKAPAGFPLDPTKWSVTFTDTTQRTQTTPTQNTWYNIGSQSTTIPIGVWNVYFRFVMTNTTANKSVMVTLSTANNSESDASLTSGIYYPPSASIQAHVTNNFILVLAAKTTYYINTRTITAASGDLLLYNNETYMVIRATCAYL